MTEKEPATVDAPSAEAKELVNALILAHLQPRIDRFFQSVERVDSLVAINEQLAEDDAEDGRDDILRAAVVLLHATLEDFLRGLAASHLPTAGESALNAVPLVSTDPTGRPEKFFLGRLAQYRDKTVSQIIEESVEQHLARSNFNNCSEIASLFASLDLDTAAIRVSFPEIDALMSRRHQIVHRADMIKTAGGERVEPLTVDQVKEWRAAASAFLAKALTSLALADIKAKRLTFEPDIVVIDSESVDHVV